MSYSPEQITSSPELKANLRLIRSDGIGPVSFQRLLQKQGTALEAIAMLEAAARKGTAKTTLATTTVIDNELETAASLNANYLFIGHDEYPALLSELSDAPAALMLRGNTNCLNNTTIGVVGARNCSAGGAKITRRICGDLADRSFTIVSGMARGIDTAAHYASVDAGTIACLAGGVDMIYPPENADLYEKITEAGLVVSEMAPGTKPLARHFPRRNRIISGLSKGILVIEAALRSGSLITASYAADQNRDVFVVPGSPLDPRAQGGNKLIRDGAILVQSAEDIIGEYNTMPLLRAHKLLPPKKTKEITPEVPAVTQAPSPLPASDILTLLSPSPIHIDDLVRLSGLSAEALLSEFTMLEISGDIMRHAGGKYSRISIKNE